MKCWRKDFSFVFLFFRCDANNEWGNRRELGEQ